MRLLYGVAVALALVALVGECGERGRLGDEANYWKDRALAARHAHDTTKARNAEREMRFVASNDSLKRLLARKPLSRVVIRHDTALVPIQEFVYVRDTLLVQCELCAARLDSLVSQTADERRAADSYITALQSENARIRDKAKRDAFRARFGFYAGYGAVKLGDQVHVGPQVGVGLRFFP